MGVRFLHPLPTKEKTVEDNILRHTYRELSEDEVLAINAIKDTGLRMLSMIEDLGQSRELSLAKTKIEESVMWAVKHVTK